MVHSMTAFARVERSGPYGTLSWELRSVNSRYLEPHLRLPETFRDLEGAVREALRQGLSRGKVECTLRFAEENAGKSLQVDSERALGRTEKALQLAAEVDASRLDRAARAELAMVVSGIREDAGDLQGAHEALQIPELDRRRGYPFSPRLFQRQAERVLKQPVKEEDDSAVSRSEAKLMALVGGKPSDKS